MIRRVSKVLLILLFIGCSSSTEVEVEEAEEVEQIEEPTDDNDPVEASCSDGVQNGSETGLDCGGDCEACPDDTASTNFGTFEKVLDLNDIGFGGRYAYHSFAVDQNSNFWMTNFELGTLHGSGTEWVRKDELNGLDVGKTSIITIDNDNRAWTTFGASIYNFDITTGEWLIVEDRFSRTNTFSYTDMYHNSNGTHWFSGGGSYSPVQDLVIQERVEILNGRPSRFIRDYELNENYILNEQGFRREVDNFNWELTRFPDFINDIVNRNIFIKDNKFWIINSVVDIEQNPNFLYFAEVTNSTNVTSWEKKSGIDTNIKDNVAFANPGGNPQIRQIFNDSDNIWLLVDEGSTFRHIWFFDPETIDFIESPRIGTTPFDFRITQFVLGKDGNIYLSISEATQIGTAGTHETIWKWTPPNLVN